MSSSPLVLAEDLRVDVDGVPAIDGLTLQTSGERVLVLGTPHAFFEALGGLRPVVRGRLHVRGVAASQGVREGSVAAAPLDPPLPPKWTALEYVTWSARLSGQSRADATTLAKEALGRVQLDPSLKHALARHAPHAKRAVVLAAAIATGAEVLVVEDPLAGLPEDVAAGWATVLVAALEKRPWVVLASRVALMSPLAMNADEAIVISGGRQAAQGPPSELATAHRFVARMHGPGEGGLDALAEKLAARGARMDVQGAQVLLDLGSSLSTAELLGMAVEAEVAVVELVPLAHALS